MSLKNMVQRGFRVTLAITQAPPSGSIPAVGKHWLLNDGDAGGHEALIAMREVVLNRMPLALSVSLFPFHNYTFVSFYFPLTFFIH